MTDGNDGIDIREQYTLSLVDQGGGTPRGLLDLVFNNPSVIINDIGTKSGVDYIVVEDIEDGINNAPLTGYDASRNGNTTLALTANTFGNKPDLSLDSYNWVNYWTPSSPYTKYTLALAKVTDGNNATERVLVTFGNSNLTGTIRITNDSTNYDVSVLNGDTASQVATKVVSQIITQGGVAGYDMLNNGDGTITFIATTTGDKPDLTISVQ